MSTIHEFGHVLRARRAEMGLSQRQVAALSGLSRQTVNQVETGAVPDLGINKVERLASVLGVALRVDTGRPGTTVKRKLSPLARAAATASVSYRDPVTGTTLKKIITTGQVPEKYIPHVHALLDDAPVSLLAAVVDQLHDETGVRRDAVWKNYRSVAREVKSKRDMWA